MKSDTLPLYPPEICKQVGPSALIVYDRLLYLCSRDRIVYHSQKQLSEELGMSQRTVRRSIGRLLDSHLLQLKYKGNNHKTQSNTYRIAGANMACAKLFSGDIDTLKMVFPDDMQGPLCHIHTDESKGQNGPCVNNTEDNTDEQGPHLNEQGPLCPPKINKYIIEEPKGSSSILLDNKHNASAYTREEIYNPVEEKLQTENKQSSSESACSFSEDCSEEVADPYALPEEVCEPTSGKDTDTARKEISFVSPVIEKSQSSMQPEEFGFVSPVANNNHLPPVALTPLQDQENEMVGYNTKLQFKEYVEKLMGPYLLQIYPVATKDFVDPNKVEKLLASGKIDQTIKALEHEANSGHHPEWKISDYEIGVANMTKLTKVFNMFLETPEDIFYRKFDKWQQRQVA